MRSIAMILIVVLVGCSPVTTYPPIETDFALKFANSAKEPVPTIITRVLLYAHEHFGGMDTIVFNLPVGVGSETYIIVANKLVDALPMTRVNQPAYHIVELRVRGFEADADVVFPSTSGQYEMATLHLDSSLIRAWEVTRDHIWLVPIHDAPLPNAPKIEQPNLLINDGAIPSNTP